jgi:hypothetical protein
MAAKSRRSDAPLDDDVGLRGVGGVVAVRRPRVRDVTGAIARHLVVGWYRIPDSNR